MVSKTISVTIILIENLCFNELYIDLINDRSEQMLPLNFCKYHLHVKYFDTQKKSCSFAKL